MRPPRLPRRSVLLAILAALVFPGLSKRASADRINIVATTAMIGDIVRNVAGDHAAVTTLMGAGVDPHLFKATRSDTAKMLRADVVFYNGLLLEGKMVDALVRIASTGKPVVPVTELLDESFLMAPEEFEGHYDPHVWMDPLGWRRAVDVVEAKLIEFKPDLAPDFADNAERYRARIDELHAYADEAMATIPESRRVLVTAHDAFNYMAQRYGLEVRGIQGLSTESEAGVRDLQEIINLLVERRIPAVFTESTVPDRNVRALINGSAARGHNVRIGGELFSDAMGAPGTYRGTYVGMIDHNVTTIVRALGGEAPAGGMQGRLTEGE